MIRGRNGYGNRATPRGPMRRIIQTACIVLLASPLPVFADLAAEVAALERKCEEAREAKLKPLREAEIAKCKASKREDPAFCDRYWSDYGNAVRQPNGTMSPRKFDDLPECVAAENARTKLRLGQ